MTTKLNKLVAQRVHDRLELIALRVYFAAQERVALKISAIEGDPPIPSADWARLEKDMSRARSAVLTLQKQNSVPAASDFPGSSLYEGTAADTGTAEVGNG